MYRVRGSLLFGPSGPLSLGGRAPGEIAIKVSSYATGSPSPFRPPFPLDPPSGPVYV
jgi:hypothetical protein